NTSSLARRWYQLSALVASAWGTVSLFHRNETATGSRRESFRMPVLTPRPGSPWARNLDATRAADTDAIQVRRFTFEGPCRAVRSNRCHLPTRETAVRVHASGVRRLG